MLDLKLIRQDTDRVRAALEKRGGADEVARLDRILERDRRRRDLLGEVETMKHERNETSREIGRLRAAGEEAGERMARMKKLSGAIKSLDREVKQIEADIGADLQWLPNLPHDAVPPGRDESDNVVLRIEGERPRFDFEPRDHLELGRRLDIFDFEGAAKLAGSGFAVLKGAGARLIRALIQWMLDLHTSEHGYTEVWTPAMARESCLYGTGQLPKLREDMYGIEGEDSFMIPTAEVTITGLWAGKTVPEADLPVKSVGYTPCFRREAGAAGRDTRGLLRVHQFDKVELVRIAHPDRSWTDHGELLEDAARVLRALGLHFRVVELAAGDLGFAAARCHDLELWAPGEGRWLEISSCSNFVDFQSRRLGIRMQPEGGGRARLCHTLNASGVALPRLIVALLEQNQTAAGGVRLPAPLSPYMGGMTELGPARAAARA